MDKIGALNMKKKDKAFTLAEVLISLTVIGVVAAMTIPALMQKIQEQEYRSGAKSAFSIINTALKKAVYDNGNAPIGCFYWKKSPYSGAYCSNYNSDGDCTKYLMPDGSGLPSDYNGHFEECNKLIPAMIKNLIVEKRCELGTSVNNGCIPIYKGNDQVYIDGNTTATQYDANKATSGCSGWRTSNFANKESIVLNNGMIIMPYSTSFQSSPIIAIDINGKRKPNKFGYDVFAFETRGSADNMAYYPGGCGYSEQGGHTSSYYVY